MKGGWANGMPSREGSSAYPADVTAATIVTAVSSSYAKYTITEQTWPAQRQRTWKRTRDAVTCFVRTSATVGQNTTAFVVAAPRSMNLDVRNRCR